MSHRRAATPPVRRSPAQPASSVIPTEPPSQRAWQLASARSPAPALGRRGAAVIVTASAAAARAAKPAVPGPGRCRRHSVSTVTTVIVTVTVAVPPQTPSHAAAVTVGPRCCSGPPRRARRGRPTITSNLSPSPGRVSATVARPPATGTVAPRHWH